MTDKERIAELEGELASLRRDLGIANVEIKSLQHDLVTARRRAAPDLSRYRVLAAFVRVAVELVEATDENEIAHARAMAVEALGAAL